MKDLKGYIVNEAKEIDYRVAFIDCKDKEDLPISVTITIESKDKEVFEKFLKDQQDNIFIHAGGGDIEY